VVLILVDLRAFKVCNYTSTEFKSNEVANQGHCLDLEQFEQVRWQGLFTSSEYGN
jgi:hypothetical protein